jgi:hypothetical protein
MEGFDISGLKLPLKKTDEEEQSVTRTLLPFDCILHCETFRLSTKAIIDEKKISRKNVHTQHNKKILYSM